MENIKIIPVLWLYGTMACADSSGEASVPAAKAISRLSDAGARRVLLIDSSADEKMHEDGIKTIKELSRSGELTLIAAGHVKHFDDVKKYLYAGCAAVLFDSSSAEEMKIYSQSLPRFGEKRIIASNGWCSPAPVLPSADYTDAAGICSHACDSSLNAKLLFVSCKADVDYKSLNAALGDTESEADEHLCEIIPSLKWEELKLNSDGLIPCIVQDYATNEVLMMAYMNKAAYEETLSGGLMVYFSRSRKERWLKGETSGSFQYVKSLTADCDKDTLLAKVLQVGNACHTGARSCFFNEIAVFDDKKPSDPLKIFETVYSTLLDRKAHPRVGSYTNYLYEKGIDKILKKCGEEASEIIIAAKNDNNDEIVYEISDFLYHLMVMMAYRGIEWNQVVEELARREG